MGERWIRRMAGSLVLLAGALGLSACGEDDPGALGATGLKQTSASAQRQDYVEGVDRALSRLGVAQGPSFSRAIASGERRQLEMSALAWDEGVQMLRQLDPPEEAVAQHRALVASTQALAGWNRRMVGVAPDRKKVAWVAKQASMSPQSAAYEKSVCGLVEVGYDVVPPELCGPMSEAEGPVS